MQEKIQMNDYCFKTEPYDHQRTAFDESRKLQNFALFMDMGTGKTKVVLDTIGIAFEEGKIDLALVVAPKGVVANWLSEIETHLPDRIVREIVLWKPSLTKTKRAELNSLYEGDRKLRFLLMNVEAFSTKKGVDVAKLFVERFDTFMVVDESTTIKNRQAKRTKALCAVGRGARFRRILTGSPVTKSPLDLFSQLGFLDPEYLDLIPITLSRTAMR
tara:strand:- start:426 stop:1073 length:648 start_codon:yes stop_codon:yes gene_type:complete